MGATQFNTKLAVLDHRVEKHVVAHVHSEWLRRVHTAEMPWDTSCGGDIAQQAACASDVGVRWAVDVVLIRHAIVATRVGLRVEGTPAQDTSYRYDNTEWRSHRPNENSAPKICN
ncbi:MAG: hypothetical protein DME33_12850 [Verrucomicrobia bacterium]|nr:MAG: hypothetical protein DME33_12850 [Verrucomicrobiota bacterium]